MPAYLYTGGTDSDISFWPHSNNPISSGHPSLVETLCPDKLLHHPLTPMSSRYYPSYQEHIAYHLSYKIIVNFSTSNELLTLPPTPFFFLYTPYPTVVKHP